MPSQNHQSMKEYIIYTHFKIVSKVFGSVDLTEMIDEDATEINVIFFSFALFLSMSAFIYERICWYKSMWRCPPPLTYIFFLSILLLYLINNDIWWVDIVCSFDDNLKRFLLFICSRWMFMNDQSDRKNLL